MLVSKLNGKNSPLFLSYSIYNNSFLSFLLKQGSTLFLYLHPLRFQDCCFGKKLALKEKSALIPPRPIFKDGMGPENPRGARTFLCSDLTVAGKRNEGTHTGGVAMGMKEKPLQLLST